MFGAGNKVPQSQEPIPLRTITVLLNYERMISDWRYRGESLIRSSLVEPKLVSEFTRKLKSEGELQNIPKSVKKQVMNEFGHHEKGGEKHPSTTFLVHPKASQDLKDFAILHSQNMESMYYETLAQDGCFQAIGLYQYFFDKCHPNQQFSIQITNESHRLVQKGSQRFITWAAKGPTRMTISHVIGTEKWYYNGTNYEEDHIVMVFPPRSPGEKQIVLDMTRLQYGEAGRGDHGENYFIGTLQDWKRSMAETHEEMNTVQVSTDRLEPGDDAALIRRLKACADRAWNRWQNRDKEGWCEYCGKGGDLTHCTKCKKKKVRYCSKEHEKAGLHLHKYTCENAR